MQKLFKGSEKEEKAEIMQTDNHVIDYSARGQRIQIMGISMSNNDFLPADKISELIEYIINKFAEEGLTQSMAHYIVQKTDERLGDFALMKPVVGEYSVVKSES